MSVAAFGESLSVATVIVVRSRRNQVNIEKSGRAQPPPVGSTRPPYTLRKLYDLPPIYLCEHTSRAPATLWPSAPTRPVYRTTRLTY